MARCPKTAAEAFKRLDKRLSEGEKKVIRDAEDMVEFHFSLGLWIRNYWIPDRMVFIMSLTSLLWLFVPIRRKEPSSI